MSIHITDSNFREVVERSKQAGFTAGALPRRSKVGELKIRVGDEMFAVPMFSKQVPLIPQSEWQSRIRAMEAAAAFIGQRWKSDTKADFQNGLGYCWAYSLAQSTMACRAAMGQNFVQLSAESLAQCVGYRNRGYYLDDALKYAAENGIASRLYVPQHKISKDQWDAGYLDDRQNYMPAEWWDLGGADVWAETVTALLLGYGCYVGYDWWGHAVFLDRLRIGTNGKIEVHTPNSHGDGNDAWLAGNRAIPSMGSFVLRSVTYT